MINVPGAATPITAIVRGTQQSQPISTFDISPRNGKNAPSETLHQALYDAAYGMAIKALRFDISYTLNSGSTVYTTLPSFATYATLNASLNNWTSVFTFTPTQNSQQGTYDFTIVPRLPNMAVGTQALTSTAAPSVWIFRVIV